MNKLEEYIQRYTKLHSSEEGYKVDGIEKVIHPGSKFFNGDQFIKYLVKRIVRVKMIKPNLVFNILDYGSGKGTHVQQVQKILGSRLQSITLYDPCVVNFSKKPLGKYNLITCADVMEHVPEEHVTEVLDEIYSYADTNAIFMFSISGKPAKKNFLDGENFHCTQKPLEWWQEKFSKYTNYTELLFHHLDETTSTNKINENQLDLI